MIMVDAQAFGHASLWWQRGHATGKIATTIAAPIVGIVGLCVATQALVAMPCTVVHAS